MGERERRLKDADLAVIVRLALALRVSIHDLLREFSGHEHAAVEAMTSRPPNGSTLSSRRHEVLRCTLTRGF